MQELKVSDLKPHPQNDYFFDDIYGDNWKDFLKSIEERGVIEPIVVTQDLTIVSGHQRVRACKELGKDVIMTDMRNYQNDDDILRDLIDTNLKQRGIGNPNPIKLGRCIKELERIYGIRNGRPNKLSDNLKVSQTDIAEDIGVTVQQYHDYKNLTKLLPELQELIQDNNSKLSATTGYKILAKMSLEDQEKMFFDIGKDKIASMTQKQTQEYIDKAKQLEEENSRLHREKASIQSELQREKSKEPVVKTEVVDNTDYTIVEKAKQLEKKIAQKDAEYNRLHGEYSKKAKEVVEIQKQMESLRQSKEEKQYVEELEQNSLLFCAKVEKFIKEVGGLAYLSNHINELSKPNQQAYLKCVELINAWGQNVLANTHQYL